MLNAQGIEAYPVILSTRSHGKLRINYPFAHFFNYVVVTAKIDSSSILLDATQPLSNFAEIPSRCINDKGFIIQKDKEEWVNLKSNAVAGIEYHLDLKPDPDKDSLSQTCRLITTGYEAIAFRNKFSTTYKELKDNILGNNSLSADTIKATDLYKIEKPFEINFNKNIALESIEDKMIISPFWNLPIVENPLKQSVRNYPIDFTYKRSYKYQSTISIPVGYKLLTKPENLNIDNEMVRIIFTADIQNTGTIKVTGVYEFRKVVYGSTDYMNLKFYFNKIVDKFNEKVVLIKV
jgi:hypothetical protein